MTEAAGTAPDILAELGATGRITGFACRFTIMRAERPDLYTEWLKVRDDDDWWRTHSQRDVSDFFGRHGFTVTAQTIGNHRRGACSRCRTA